MKKLLVLSILALSGCTGITRVELTGLDHYSGWSDQIRELASHSWKYAQLSQNIYEDGFDFEVAGYFHPLGDYPNDGIDFFATLFQDKKNVYGSHIC